MKNYHKLRWEWKFDYPSFIQLNDPWVCTILSLLVLSSGTLQISVICMELVLIGGSNWSFLCTINFSRSAFHKWLKKYLVNDFTLGGVSLLKIYCRGGVKRVNFILYVLLLSLRLFPAIGIWIDWVAGQYFAVWLWLASCVDLPDAGVAIVQ